MRSNDTVVAVVGGGAAGITAAIGLAKRGVPVVVIEGAPYPGAENWSGAVYFCENLVRPEILGPGVLETAAVERRVIKRGLLLSDGRTAVGGAVRSKAAFEHCYTVLRPVFDHDLAARARLHGAEILTRTTALGLLRDGDRVYGVLTDRGPITADLVFLAEGDAARLVTREGLETKAARPGRVVEPEFLQGVKEVLALDPSEIERRFGVGPGEGACFEILLKNGTIGGRPFELNAGAFLYTNRDSISLGLVAPLERLKALDLDYNVLMERLKALPALRPLLEGATQRSFGAKLIRGGGYAEMPRLVLDGLVVGGAAAGLGVDFPCPNYTGPATYSGFLVSEATHRIRTTGRAFDAAALREHYEAPLRASHYVADAAHLEKWPHFVATAREFFGRQVDLVAGVADDVTREEHGFVGRHLIAARRVVETLPFAKAKTFLAEMRRAGDALGTRRGLAGAVLRALPAMLWNCVAGFFPSRPRTDSVFEPVFLADPDPLRLRAPRSIRFYRARFGGAFADALFHLYRNDATPLSAKLARARDAILRRVALWDLLVVPFATLGVWILGNLHRLGFLAWVALRKPKLDAILATPSFKRREEARKVGELRETRTKVAHDDKLALITYRGDATSHINFHVTYDRATGLPEVASPVFHVCPAHVYRREVDQSLASSVAVLHENCVKCETCWRADADHVDWGRTRSQALVYEAYTPADAWLRESLEAAAWAELGRRPAAEPRALEPAAPPRVVLDAPRLARVDALLARMRAAIRGLRPLHDALPSVLLGADQDLLGRVAGDAFEAAAALDAELRPVADLGLTARLDALRAWADLAAPRRAAKRFFDLETDLALLAVRHLPDLEARLGVSAPPAPVGKPDPARARFELRGRLAARLDKDAVAATERAGRPAGPAEEVLRDVVRELVRRNGGSAPPPGSAPRDLLLEELARLSPSLAVAAHAHLVALDLAQAPTVAGDAEDLREVRVALLRATPRAAFVSGAFRVDADGRVSGSAVAAVAGAPLVVVAVGEDLCVFGADDEGVRVEQPGALGLVGAGVARLELHDATPRARFSGAPVATHLAASAPLDVVAIARGMTDYAAARAYDHAASRVQFPGLFRDVRGRDGVAKFGAVQAMLAGIAESRALLEALRGARVHGATAAALATELLGPGPRSVLYLAGQALGGTAYSEEDPICRLFRDSAALDRVPYDARAATRRHGRRQLRLLRGGVVADGADYVGLDLRPKALVAEESDSAERRPWFARVREGWRALRRALEGADVATAESLAADAGRLALLTGGFDALAASARAARAGGVVDPVVEAALERLAERVASKAERLARRVADADDLVALGRLLWREGVAEGPAHVATGAMTHYGEFLAQEDPFVSGDLVTRPGRAGRLCWSPELLEADPLLGRFEAETVAEYRARWRDRLHEGLPYPRLVERDHRVPLDDVRRLLADGAFRRVIPERDGGLGWKKAKYYLDCVAMMRHGDPSQPLIVMGSTSIGTTPILLGLEQDLPAAKRAIEDALAHPERVAAVAEAVQRVRRMLDGPEAAKVKQPFEELAALVKKSLQGEKILRLAFQRFLDAFMDAGRAGLKKDVGGMRAGLDRAAASLAGWDATLKAELDSLEPRAAMHAFYLRQIAAGRISAFALTEPSAGSDTARIRTRAERVEVEALRDAAGFYVFIPVGGSEPRNLFPLDRLTFVDGALRFQAADGTSVPVVTRDFKDADAEGPAKHRYVELGGRRVDVHDFGRVVERGGKTYFPYFRVNGQKMWITNGSLAGVMSLYARTDRGPTGFMLDAHQEGLVVGKDEEKMGQRGSATNELALKDVRIPVDAVVGIEGRGQENALETLNVGRAGLSITSVGTMHEIVIDARAALRREGREPGPTDLLELGKMAADLVGSESLAYQLVGRFDHKGTKSIRVESALGKAETSEALHRMLLRAERLTGPATVLADGLLEKRRRDARVLTIYEGTNEIQRFLMLKDLVDALPTDPPPLEAPETTTAGVAAGLAALAAARAETLRRAADVRARLGSKAWQDVRLQPWMFKLVEAYGRVSVLSAAVRRTALANRLIRDDAGRPRLEYLERALKLLAKAASELPQDLLAAFDREAARVVAGLDPWALPLADRALLAHEAAHAEPPEPEPPVVAPRPLRVLVVVDPAPAAAPVPRVVDGRLAETWCELSPQDRRALVGALRLKGGAGADVSVVGVGGPAAAAVLEETLALGADHAHLVNIGRRALLAADVAGFVAGFVRVQEDLHGPFDLVVGADAHAGLLLPLARRLDLEAVRGVAAFGASSVDGAAAFPVRLESPRVEVLLRKPSVLLTAGELPPHAAEATLEGRRRARRLGVTALEFAPSEAPEGRLVAATLAPATSAAPAAGPLGADAAARAFAAEAGLSGAAPAAASPYDGPFVAASPEPFAEAAAVAVIRADADGPSPAARAAIDAALFVAGDRRAALLALVASDDEDVVRRAAGSLVGSGADVILLADPGLSGLSESRLGRALERAFAGSSASAVFAADLRGAGLAAAEGRAIANEALVLVDGVDRIEASGGVVSYSGARLDGRARYSVSRPASAPVQLFVRGDVEVAGAPARGSGRATTPVLLGLAPADASADDDLARALRAAEAELGVASLAEADFVLDVGYGVGSRDGLEEAVEPLKAALERLGVKNVMIGASRKVTQDLGILPDSAQIGQTGVSVNPKVMIALGVSGAPQHVNYIGDRAVIFAFNKDPEAPLMVLNRSRPRPRVFPIQGDLFTEVPRFIRALDLAVGAAV